MFGDNMNNRAIYSKNFRKLASRWMLCGLGIKRWLFLFAACLFAVGYGYFDASRGGEEEVRDMTLISISIVLAVFSLFKIMMFVENILKIASEGHLDDYFDGLNKRKSPLPKIVMIGGGTGLSTLLRGIREYSGHSSSENLVAVVTVADNGGSSGRLREEMNILPPGDIRNCLIALSTEEPLLTKLFQYRFKDTSKLSGHSFGNLFIAALTDVTGDFLTAVKESSKVLAVSGKVLPSTNVPLSLRATYEDGTVINGESQIAYNQINKKICEIGIVPADALALPEAIAEIEAAKVIVIGPGSLYTSLIPNLLIKGICESLKKSSAVKIYICNVMTQPGETDNYSASDHLKAIDDVLGGRCIDYIVVSDISGASEELMAKYRATRAAPVKIDIEKLTGLGVKVVRADLSAAGDFLRHDPDRLARCVLNIIKKEIEFEKV